MNAEELLLDNEEFTQEEAIEWIDYNTIRALPYMGEDGPIIMYDLVDISGDLPEEKIFFGEPLPIHHGDTGYLTPGAAIEALIPDSYKYRRELDAAVYDLEEIMFKGGDNLDTCQYCKTDGCYNRGGYRLCDPQWRGIVEV